MPLGARAALALPDGGKEEDAQQQIALRALKFWGRPPEHALIRALETRKGPSPAPAATMHAAVKLLRFIGAAALLLAQLGALGWICWAAVDIRMHAVNRMSLILQAVDTWVLVKGYQSHPTRVARPHLVALLKQHNQVPSLLQQLRGRVVEMLCW